jgi:hypothetical protein
MLQRPPMLTDTHPEAAQVQLDLIRRASVAKRISMMRSLTATLVSLSRRGIAEANPGMSEQDVNLHWAEINYGKELADEVRDYLIRAADAT